MADATVRLRVPGSGWRTIPAEGVSLSANDWGPDGGGFTIPAGIVASAELAPFSPCEVEIDGATVWAGDLLDPAPGDGAVQVRLRGAPYQLDDDPFERAWVHSRLADWKDLRSFPGAGLGRKGTSAGQVEVGDGAIVLSWPSGTDFVSGQSPPVGAVLDLGPDSEVKRISIDYVRGSFYSTVGDMFLDVRNAGQGGVWDTVDSEDAIYEDVTALQGMDTLTATFTDVRRYVAIILTYQGLGGTTTVDTTIQIVGARCYRKVAYESGGQSVLKDSDVAADCLAFAPRLSQDVSLIEASTAPLSGYAPLEPKSGREHIEASSSITRPQNTVGADLRLRKRPWPIVPTISLAVDAVRPDTHGSGEGLYNRVVVTGQAPSGASLRVVRHSAVLIGATLIGTDELTISNPSFDTDTAGWTASGAGATITRQTVGVFVHSASGGGYLAPSGGFLAAGSAAQISLGGSPVTGRTYIAELWTRQPRSSLYPAHRILLGTPDNQGELYVDATYGWGLRYVVWVPKAGDTAPRLRIESMEGGETYNLGIDTIRLFRSETVLLDRQDLVRTRHVEVSGALLARDLAALGDVFLAEHATPPVAEQVEVRAGDATNLATGEPLHPSRLLLAYGEVARLDGAIDLSTADRGRDARIANVTYDHDTETATVALDSDEGSFDALLASYGGTDLSAPRLTGRLRPRPILVGEEGTVVPPPPVPTGLTATVSGSSVLLAWTQVSQADSYKLYRSDNGGTFAYIGSAATSATSYTDPNRTGGVTYCYTITSVNAGPTPPVESAQSAQACVTMPGGTGQVPGQVVGLWAAADPLWPGQLYLSWDAASGATGYKVYTSPGNVYVGTTTSTSYYADATPDVYRCFKVLGYNTVGDGPLSAEACGMAYAGGG